MGNTTRILIGDRLVGPQEPCLIIGEVAQAHDGSLGMAHAFIDAIAAAGADAVKFQTHIAHAESSAQEPYRVRFSPQDETRYDYWKRMEFSMEQWFGLAEHAREKGLLFLSSPFSEEAVDLLSQVGVPAWKIASGEVNNPILFESIAQSQLPVLLSTGMSPLDEIDHAVSWVKQHELPLAVFQCTSRYPSPPETIGLNMLSEFADRYEVPVGLSDHSGTIYAGLAAVTLGASLLEVHVVLSKDMFGPDVIASVTPADLKSLVEGARFIEKSLAHPMDKDKNADEMSALREIFGQALVAKRDLNSGHRIARADLTSRKPAFAGIPSGQLSSVIDKKLVKDLKAGDFITASDLES